MSDAPETLAAIPREMRREAGAQTNPSPLYRYADRIEAAAEHLRDATKMVCDTPEPLAAILAEMRDGRIIHIEDADTTRCLLRNLADRIEAAVKRERAITDAMLAMKDKPLPHPDPEHAPPLFSPMTKTQLQTLSDLVAIAHDEMDGLPYHEQELERFDSLLSDMKARALAAPPEPPSNAAAMREALEKAWELLDGDDRQLIAYSDTGALMDIIKPALSAPARNCDVSRDTKETIERCLADLNVESSSASFDAGVCAAIGWLFAPAEGGVK